MPIAPDQAAEPSFTAVTCVALGLGVLALARTLLVMRAAAERLGPTLVAEEPRSPLKWLRLLLVAGAALALTLAWDEGAPGAYASAGLLAVTAALAHLTPSASSQRYCVHGVRRGFDARRFEELEEWRLAGEHLRWKLDGEWTSCRVPPELHADLRAKLGTLNPTGESRFA